MASKLNIIKRKVISIANWLLSKSVSVIKFIKRKAVLIFNWFLPGCEFKPFIISSLHAVWMIAFSLLWLVHINMFDGFDLMNDVMDYRDLLTKNILNVQSGSDIKTKYLLINTSNNNQLIAADNDNQINMVITDREKLTRVLNILNDNSGQIKYIICDIFFGEADTVHDNALEDVLTLLDRKMKLIIPYYIVEDEDFIHYPIFEANHGLSQYKPSFLNTQYLKFSYISFDTIKQIPLIVYEDITGRSMNRREFSAVNFYTIGGKWCLNTIIPEFRYTSYDLIPDETLFDLGFFTADQIGKDQIVIIGDFEGVRDKHHSIVDQVAGPLIIVNALEALMHGDNMVEMPYLFLLFLFFTLISYHTFYKTRIKKYLSENRKPRFIIDYLRSNINYLLILLLTLVSMLFFHHYFHLFILLGYFAVIEIGLGFVKTLIKNRKVNHA